ncbi:hypothetical protein CIB84_016549, partial [Bambusicola thoracicus]
GGGLTMGPPHPLHLPPPHPRAVRPGPELPAGLAGAAAGGPPRAQPARLPEPGAARVGGSRAPLPAAPRPAPGQPPRGVPRLLAVPGLHLAAAAAVPGGVWLHRGVPAGPARQRLPALLQHLPLQLPAAAGPRWGAAASHSDLHPCEQSLGSSRQHRVPSAPRLGLGAALQPATAGAIPEPGVGPRPFGDPRCCGPSERRH